jgi:hypothetical protein
MAAGKNWRNDWIYTTGKNLHESIASSASSGDCHYTLARSEAADTLVESGSPACVRAVHWQIRPKAYYSCGFYVEFGLKYRSTGHSRSIMRSKQLFSVDAHGGLQRYSMAAASSGRPHSPESAPGFIRHNTVNTGFSQRLSSQAQLTGHKD